MFYEPGRTVNEVLGWENDFVAPFHHVLPLNDARTHPKGVDCWCSPRYEEYPGPFGGRICTVVHNSADGREDYDHGVRRHN